MATNNIVKFSVGSYLLQIMLIMCFIGYGALATTTETSITGMIGAETSMGHQYTDIDPEISGSTTIQGEQTATDWDPITLGTRALYYFGKAISLITMILLPAAWLGVKLLTGYSTGHVIYYIVSMILFFWQGIQVYYIVKLIVKPERFQ